MKNGTCPPDILRNSGLTVPNTQHGESEGIFTFVAGLNPEIWMQVGIHVDRNGLNAAIVIVEKVDCYQRVEVEKR